MTPGFSVGPTMYCAPARIAARAVSGSSTLPTPIKQSLPSLVTGLVNDVEPPGVVIVTSATSDAALGVRRLKRIDELFGTIGASHDRHQAGGFHPCDDSVVGR